MSTPQYLNQKEIKTGCVIVLYRPNIDNLIQIIAKWKEQVDELILVDNTPDRVDYDFSKFEIEYISLGANKGIAYAQNRGIKALIDKKVDYVVFSDQDSVPSNNVVNSLLKVALKLDNMSIKTAALGVRARNSFSGKLYGYKSKIIGKPGNAIPGLSNVTEVYSVISSGSMIPITSFIENGGFDESLFIDGVDHEWCWRGWHGHKLRSFIIEDATISHAMGEGDRNILGHSIGISSAKRLYFQYRNFIWLHKRSITPSYWKKINLKKYIAKSFYFPLMVSPRIENLKNILMGIRDGIRHDNGEPIYPTFKD